MVDGLGFGIGIGVGQYIDEHLSAASVKDELYLRSFEEFEARICSRCSSLGRAVPGMQTLSFGRAAASGDCHQTWGGLDRSDMVDDWLVMFSFPSITFVLFFGVPRAGLRASRAMLRTPSTSGRLGYFGGIL